MTHSTPAGDAVPATGGIDPAADPQGYLTELLVRYFRPGMVDSLIRVWVPVGIGSALSWINANWSVVGLPEQPSATATIIATGITIAGYYAGARWVERRLPRVGRWLVALNLTKSRPTYAEPAAAAQVEAAAATPAGRHH